MDNQIPNPNNPIYKVDPMPPEALKKNWFSAHLVLGVVFLVAVAAAIVAGIYYWQTVRQIPSSAQTPVHKDATANWKTYTNSQNGFEFRYPGILTLTESGGKVTLSHSIPYENNGPCDMIGDTKTYPTLVDFNMSFELSAKKLTLAYVDGQFKGGDLEGPWAYQGAEGCGNSLYYFSWKTGTLIVSRESIQALSGARTPESMKEILKVPDVISYQENEKIFNQILSTFKFVNSDSVFCGGIAGIPCPTIGYICTLEGNYPDAGTICKKQ